MLTMPKKEGICLKMMLLNFKLGWKKKGEATYYRNTYLAFEIGSNSLLLKQKKSNSSYLLSI